jgi:hypothetical protein
MILMPTIERREGFRFEIYRNDHEPAHVHVVKAGGVAVIEVRSSPVAVRDVYRMKANDLRRAVRIVEENRMRYLDAWEREHGRA